MERSSRTIALQHELDRARSRWEAAVRDLKRFDHEPVAAACVAHDRAALVHALETQSAMLDAVAVSWQAYVHHHDQLSQALMLDALTEYSEWLDER